MHAVYTSAQIRLIEKQAIKQNISGDDMMQKAAQAAFKLIQEQWPTAKNILILTGGGNNGGDGWALATLLKKNKTQCTVHSIVDPHNLKNEAKHAYESALHAQVTIQQQQTLDTKEYDLIVDALLGIGIKGQLKHEILNIIKKVNQSRKPVLSIDIPSGLCADRGIALPIAIHATSTITFIGMKSGLVTANAADYCGKIIVDTLNLSTTFFTDITPPIHIAQSSDFTSLLIQRTASAHKGNFGHVLIIGSNKGMSGAAKLAGLGALRTGAGLVSIATHPQHANLLNITQAELMCHAIEKAKNLLPLIEKASCVVIGPGLGQDEWAKNIFKLVCKVNDKPLIIDADALNLLAKNSMRFDNAIVTPHPGEAARLLNCDIQEIHSQRWQSAMSIQKKLGGICVLKGKGTIIFNGEHSFVCTDGNPGMASGGMGDLLSGIIASLVAQGASLTDAATLAVCLHAEAGDMAAQEFGCRGLAASDLLPFLRKLVNP